MTFAAAVQTMATPLRLRVLWLMIAMVAAPLVLLVFRANRRDGVVVLASTLAVPVSVQALYHAMGFVRLLGLAHVVIWGPPGRVAGAATAGRCAAAPGTGVMAVFFVTICISLVFDVIDMARWLAGDRESLVSLGGEKV